MKYHGVHDLLKSLKCCITLLIYDTGFRFRKEFHDRSKSQRSGLRVHLLRHNEDSLCFENEWTRPVKRKGFDGSQVVLLRATSSLLRTFCSYKVKLSLRVIVEWVWPVPRRFTCRPLTVWHVAGARVCVCARALLPRPHPPPPPAPAAAHSRRLSSLLVCKWSLPLPPGARTPRPPAALLI